MYIISLVKKVTEVNCKPTPTNLNSKIEAKWKVSSQNFTNAREIVISKNKVHHINDKKLSTLCNIEPIPSIIISSFNYNDHHSFFNNINIIVSEKESTTGTAHTCIYYANYTLKKEDY